MNIIPASYCRGCRFYHGDHQVICGLHPYGPVSHICRDYAPEAGLQNSTNRGGWNIYRF